MHFLKLLFHKYLHFIHLFSHLVIHSYIHLFCHFLLSYLQCLMITFRVRPSKCQGTPCCSTVPHVCYKHYTCCIPLSVYIQYTLCVYACCFQEFLQHYVSQFERVLVNIREKCRLDSSAVDAEEWSTFQNSLRIIQTCGNYLVVNYLLCAPV